jgi:hypothetical protein
LPKQHTPNPKPTLEKGSGGPKTPPKTDTISDEDSAAIRKNDPKRYNELVKQGKI